MRPLSTTTGPAFRNAQPWTAARWFLLVTAVVHIPLGVAGLVADRSFPIGAGAAGSAETSHVFGVFLTNGWHSLLAVILGVVALYFTLNPGRARSVALAVGVIHVGVVAALVVREPSTFWIASNNADQVVHASSALGGIACGLLTPPAVDQTDPSQARA